MGAGKNGGGGDVAAGGNGAGGGDDDCFLRRVSDIPALVGGNVTGNGKSALLSSSAAAEARMCAERVAGWYLATLDPYAPHGHNIATRLRHPVGVVTRRILHGRRSDEKAAGDHDDDLEALFNEIDDDEGDKKEVLTRRSRARMEAFLASCSVALREEGEGDGGDGGGVLKNPAPSSVGGRMKDLLDIVTMKKRSEKGEGPPMLQGRADGGVDGGGTDRQNKPWDSATMKKRSEKGDGPPMLQGRADGGVDGGKTDRQNKPRSLSNAFLKRYRQMDRYDLNLSLELYCRTLRRIRALVDADAEDAAASVGTSLPVPVRECVLHLEPKKSIRARVQLIVRTHLRTMESIQSVHKNLTAILLQETLGVLAVERWCAELRTVVDRLASEYEHKVSFASLAFLSSPNAGAEDHLAPLLVKYFEYLQADHERLASECELERMLRAVLDVGMRYFFKNAVFHSVGHLLDVCREYRTSLDNVALPPPWREGTFGLVGSGGGTTAGDADDSDAAIDRYCRDESTVRQAMRDLRREIITVNGRALPPAHSSMELAESLGNALRSNSLSESLLPGFTGSGGPGGQPRPLPSAKTGGRRKKKSRKPRRSVYASDFGLEAEEDPDDGYSGDAAASGGDSTDASAPRRVDPGIVDVLTRRLIIAASRTGSGGDAYFVVRDLFGGDEVVVVPHHSDKIQSRNQGTIEIIVKLSSVTIKSHAKFDIYPNPMVSDSDPLIQFHTTTTEVITLQQQTKLPGLFVNKSSNGIEQQQTTEVGTGAAGSYDEDAADPLPALVLREKKTDTTGWRTLTVRPAYYERVQSSNATRS